jgi:hypothetical protein
MGRGRRLQNIFWRRVRTDQRRDEGVRAGGGQLGSSARARRSLAAASPARALGLPWGRDLMLRRTEVRHGLAAAVLRIACRRKSPVRGVFGKIPVPTIF